MKKKVLNLLIYVSAYIGGIVYLVFGGYVFLKTKDKDIKKNLKISLCLFIGFLCAGLLISALSKLVVGVFGVSAYGGFSSFLSKLSSLIDFSRIIVFVVFALISFFGGNEEISDIPGNTDSATDTENNQ